MMSAAASTKFEITGLDGFTTELVADATNPEEQEELEQLMAKWMYRIHDVMSHKYGDSVLAEKPHNHKAKHPICGVSAEGLRAFSKTHPGKTAVLRICDVDDGRYGESIGIQFMGSDGIARDVPTHHLKDRDIATAYGDKSQFFRKTATKIRLQRKLDARKAAKKT